MAFGALELGPNRAKYHRSFSLGSPPPFLCSFVKPTPAVYLVLKLSGRASTQVQYLKPDNINALFSKKTLS